MIIHNTVVQELSMFDLECGMSGSGHTCLGLDTHIHNMNIVFMEMSHVIAALVQQEFFGQSLPSAHCLIGHDGA